MFRLMKQEGVEQKFGTVLTSMRGLAKLSSSLHRLVRDVRCRFVSLCIKIGQENDEYLKKCRFIDKAECVCRLQWRRNEVDISFLNSELVGDLITETSYYWKSLTLLLSDWAMEFIFCYFPVYFTLSFIPSFADFL